MLSLFEECGLALPHAADSGSEMSVVMEQVVDGRMKSDELLQTAHVCNSPAPMEQSLDR